MKEFINKLENDDLQTSTVVKNSHTDTAKVGRDTIENVEYITFSHSTLWDPADMNKWGLRSYFRETGRYLWQTQNSVIGNPDIYFRKCP